VLVRIGSRGSRLALVQAERAAELVRRPGVEVALVPITTAGDRDRTRPFGQIGERGVFVKEIEEALLAGRIDVAVHSAKDMTSEDTTGLAVGAYLARDDPRDALIGAGAIEPGMRIGTASARRRAQLLALEPTLSIEPLRGNVDTRLKRLENGELDAMVLACAGLARLGLESRISARLDPAQMLPAVGQGAIGIECRSDDAHARALLRALDDAATRTALAAERSFARTLGGSCQSPIAALARIEQDRLTLAGLVAEPDGSRLLRESASGACARAEQLGEELAQRLLESGARQLLERLRTA